MKMKKTLAIIMTAALTVGTMAGCSQATLNYSKEISNVAKWQAASSNIEGSIKVNAQGVNEQINLTATSYKVDDKSYVDMTFNDPSGKIKIPEFTAYSDGTTTYVNKSFYEGIDTLVGQPVPAGISNIKEEYIGIDNASTGISADQIKALTTQPDAMVQLGKLMFGDSNALDLPFVQNGRQYTLNLDADKTVDLAGKAIKAIGNNLENFNTNFKLGLPAESITQIKTQINDSSFDAQLATFKTTLAGTTINSKETFADDSYNGEVNMNLQIKDFGNITLALKTATTKSAGKTITFPTSVLKVTQDELIKLQTPANTAAISSTTTASK